MGKQLEAQKEEIQKSLKDIKENKAQQAEVLIEETQKSLKELEENANKQIKELNKTIQDLQRKQKQLINDKGRQLWTYKTWKEIRCHRCKLQQQNTGDGGKNLRC